MRAQRLTTFVVLVALGAVLGGCSSGVTGFDPTDLLDFLDTKKKLPGERKPVFPEGVPGLQPGVPKELYRGARVEPEPVAAPPADEAPRAKSAKSASKGTAKSRSASRPAAPEIAPDDVSVEDAPAATPAPPANAKAKIVRRRTTAPPPEEPAPVAPAAQAPARQPAQAASPFPAPLPSGTFAR